MDGVRLARAGLLAFAVAATGHALGWWEAHHWIASLPALCPVRLLTGHGCPGCGMGRSLALLAQGQVLASLHQHPFGLPFLACLSARALLPRRTSARARRTWVARSSALSVTAVALLLVWWIATTVLPASGILPV